MINIPQAVQDAVFKALNVSDLTAVAPVTQHLLENAEPPMFVIGDITTEPMGGKEGGLDRVVVEVWTYSRQANRTQLYNMQSLVRSKLDNQSIVEAGYTFSNPVETASESEMLEDGQTYVGTQRFELFAQ